MRLAGSHLAVTRWNVPGGLATGFTVKLDEQNAVSTKVEYNTKDGKPDTIGFALGYSHGF
jgi:hypothetical protein